MRVTAFATNTRRGQLAALELRHRRRARAEDRIRAAKHTGLTNLPLHAFAQNQIWCALVALACEITAWMQTLTLAGHHARRWEPKRLRYRLLSSAARLTRTARRILVRLPTPPVGRPHHHRHHPAPPPQRTRLNSRPPSLRPDPAPARGTGAHPRRHPGHCHTQLQQSSPSAAHTRRAITPDRATKDLG